MAGGIGALGGASHVGGSGIAGAPHFNSMAPSFHGSSGMAKFSHPPRMPRMGPHIGQGIAQFDDGGSVPVGPGPSGIAPTAQMSDPVVSNQLQNYQKMSAEQLQELAVRLGPQSPQGQLVQRVLQQKRMGGGDQATAAPQPMTNALYADGGEVPGQGFDLEPMPQSGLLHSAVAGRTDHIHTTVPSGSYIVPADVVSGVGEGNTLAGARIIMEAMDGPTPYGVTAPKVKTEKTIPRAPRAETQRAKGGATNRHEGLILETPRRAMGGPAPVAAPMMPPPQTGATPQQMGALHAKGGKANEAGKPVPILAAGGELVLAPHHVQHWWGGGKLKRGQKNLDAWIVHERTKIAKKMLKLPPPAKD